MNRLIDRLHKSLTGTVSSTGMAVLIVVSLAAPSPLRAEATSFLSEYRSERTASAPATVPTLQLPALSNVMINILPSGRAELRFPKDGSGFMTPGRHEFRDQLDLIDYLSQIFPVVRDEQGGARISLKQVSSYRRIGLRGQQIFTFGDPILDLITDEDGQLTVAGKVYDLRTAELSDRSQIGSGVLLEPGSRGGPQLSHAVYRGAGASYKPVRAASPAAALQSPPTSVTFSVPGGTIRVRAFRNNYGVGWKAGADIKTWGGDFTRATVDSQYGQNIFGNFCGIVKRDSDTDTNDDYVDEYEWGIASSMPSGVRSTGTILWKGLTYVRVVQSGCSGGWLGV